MGVAAHLGINLAEYDASIRTFIPHYEDMLDAAVAALVAVSRSAAVLVDLGTGTGALAERTVKAAPGACVIGIDSDEGMLGLAKKRLHGRLTAVTGDFLSTPLPRCDVITASFSLHHIKTRRQKSALYKRCFAALRPGGLLVNADCCLASSPRLQARDRVAWRTHLQCTYGRARAEGFLRAWVREDFYFELDEEIALLKSAGFAVDVPWRRDSFAVLVGHRRRQARRD